MSTHFLNSVCDHCIRGEMKSINFEFRAYSAFDCPPSVQANCHSGSISLTLEFLNHFGMPRVGLQILSSSHLNDSLHCRYENLICNLSLLLVDLLFKLLSSFLFCMLSSSGSLLGCKHRCSVLNCRAEKASSCCLIE